METVKKFIDGLFTGRREKAPESIVANLSFKTEKFVPWLHNNTNAAGYCNVDIVRRHDGSLFSALNDWQPTGDKEQLVKDGVEIKVEPRDDIMSALSSTPF